MGTRAPWSTALLLVWAAGCGGGDPPAAPVEPALHLVAEPMGVAIQPSQSKDVVFRLLDQKNQPVPERIIQFSIVDDPGKPGDDAAGATLSYDRGVTDGNGAVSLQIIAGPQATMFAVRASATRAPPLEVIVLVTHASLAPVELAPLLVDEPVAGEELTRVRLYVLDDTSCAGVRREDLPTGASPFVRAIPADGTGLFSNVATEEAHQLVAVGLDAAGVARASGCVDLPRSLLLVDVPLRVVVPMHLFRPSPEGSYDVVSHVQLRPGLASAPAVIEAWREPGLCPLDPARLWLDCTIDALRTTDTDPSDCKPTDDEGELGLKLAARRGLPLTVPAGGRCKDRMDGAGRPSLDALVGGLFPTPRPALLDGLAGLGAEAAQLLESVELRSVLDVTRTSTRAQYQVSHRLLSATFPLTTSTRIDLVGIGVPSLEARFVPALTRKSDLELSPHGFTLRLGSTARLAFGRGSLVPRGGPADTGAFVTTLFGLASRNEGGTILTGCAALDGLLCADLGQAAGCALAACTEGLATLRQRLDAGFAAMDGDDLDFVLGGLAPLVDSDGDGQVDSLGGSIGGSWSGEVRGRGGPSPVSGSWSALRAER
jgi:hypothetical protein